MSFATEMREITLKANGAVDKTVRAATIALFREVIQRTPVDTGRLRGNWQTTTGSPAYGIAERFDKTGAVAFGEALAKIGGAGSITYLTNNLPYAQRIEYDGWSHTKAPAGMVRVSFARIESIVEAAARANKV